MIILVEKGESNPHRHEREAEPIFFNQLLQKWSPKVNNGYQGD